jgi:hypothetical protein
MRWLALSTRTSTSARAGSGQSASSMIAAAIRSIIFAFPNCACKLRQNAPHVPGRPDRADKSDEHG